MGSSVFRVSSISGIAVPFPVKFSISSSSVSYTHLDVYKRQTLHNPLAAPNLIGVNAGAGVGVLFTLAFLPTLAMFMPVAAFLGALIATLLVYFIASRAGAARLTLVLAGIAVSSFCLLYTSRHILDVDAIEVMHLIFI